MSEGDTEEHGPLEKPRSLCSFAGEVTVAFDTLKGAFRVEGPLCLVLSSVESPQPELDDAAAVAAMTLRKLQALYRCALPGVPTTADVIVGLSAELERAIVDLLSTSVVQQEAAEVLKEFLSGLWAVNREIMELLQEEMTAPLI